MSHIPHNLINEGKQDRSIPSLLHDEQYCHWAAMSTRLVSSRWKFRYSVRVNPRLPAEVAPLLARNIQKLTRYAYISVRPLKFAEFESALAPYLSSQSRNRHYPCLRSCGRRISTLKWRRGYKDLKSENLKSEVCFDMWTIQCVINP